jgi:V/A-type H+-transporting ATPase subunit B
MSAPWVQREYSDIAELRGPLLVVRGVSGVGWDEFATIRLEAGETRHGLVLDADQDLAVVQVLEGTAGMSQFAAKVAFAGSPLRIPVGAGWLGRVCDGRGEPLDGGPPVTGDQTAPVAGHPVNPAAREPPSEPVLTGISVIDTLTTLARGQKLPVFSVAGLPHLELAGQLAAQATAGGEPFSVVFAAMGLTHADTASIRGMLEDRLAAGELVLLLNLADSPVIERILTPRIALTVAEHLAFRLGRHVLVVMADMTSYCEALREVSAARGEIPARRAYPGYLYSDLASLYERCGRIRGLPGSLTQVPVLTMPAGDITHPVPDLTGYITEGQIVLSADLHARGVYPPVDALASLSRLMRQAAGPGRTREDHLDVAAQLLAALARARRARELAELIGSAALSESDRRHQQLERVRGRVRAAGRARRPRPAGDAGPGLARAGHASPPRTDHDARDHVRHLLSRQAGAVTRPAAAGHRLAVPPGRAGRLWLERRLAIARRGADLLDRKLRILQRELAVTRDRAARTEREWSRSCAEAEEWLLRSALLEGQRGSRLAAPRELAEVQISGTVTMGVRHPADGVYSPPRSAAPWAAPAAAEARRACEAALGAAVRHAAAASALRILDAETTATRQRLHAIRDRWIPRLEEAKADLELTFDELERADAARLRMGARPRARRL